ncbi:MAG TPA: glycosyltransferase [Candidatus Saccharimonadales bacterium]|nr:glycosyltransferase [Candidatus Saccharimonadales bacterium]
MNQDPMEFVIIGLTITSSWGNGHATTFRGLVRELEARGHHVLFLEKDVEWYASNRDMPKPPYGRTELYKSTSELMERFASEVRNAHFVMVGSYVDDGAAIGKWVTTVAGGITAFYDIDTPVTLANLSRGKVDYLSPDLIPRYNLYLSFTGGPTLDFLEKHYGSPMARPLYCSVDPQLYYPEPREHIWDLGYMGTYSEDRQPALERLLVEPALKWPTGRFVVAGPQYPKDYAWPQNVKRFIHLSPEKHREFYNAQALTLNITRAAMIEAGYSPSVRLFEAAACGTPIISDAWPGLETIFVPGEEILIARSSEESLGFLKDIPESTYKKMGERARRKVLAEHTAAHRALEVESYARELASKPAALA